MKHGQSVFPRAVTKAKSPKLQRRTMAAQAVLSLQPTRLQQLLDQLPVGCFLIGFDWCYRYVNDCAVGYVHRPKAELLGHTVLECHPDFAKSDLYPVVAHALHQRTSACIEQLCHRPDGTPLWLELKIQPVDEGILVLAADITAHKAKAAELEQSTQELNDLYYNAPFGYHSLDQDGVFIQINDTELRWLGYQRAEIIHQRKFSDLCLPEQQARFAQAFPLLKAQGWIKDLEYDMVCKDGSTIHVIVNATAIYDEQGHYLKSRSSIFDITELKRIQRALEESEARYRLLAENVSDVMARMGPDGIRRYITPACYALLGYLPEELIGKPAIELIHPDDRTPFQQKLQQAITTKQSSFTSIQRMHHKAGHYVWAEITNNLIRQADTGAFVEVIGVMRDITARKQAETALTMRMDEDREFQDYLKALHDLTIELTPLEELDAFYLRVVELGIRYFGFDRLALFLYDEGDGTAQGTYGTDEHGHLVNEQHIRFIPSQHGILLRAYTRVERFCYEENTTLYANNQPIGQGWNAATVLGNGAQQLGWLVVDNLLHQKPATKPLLDTLGLFGLTVGTLLTQKRMQLALRASEARYRLLAENITDVVMRTNAAFECQYVSLSSRTILGYAPEELLGQSMLAFVHPDDLSPLLTIIAEAQPVLMLVLRFRHKQGHYIWLESNGRIIRSAVTGEIEAFISSARDISDRKSAEMALQESEEKYRRLIENMRGGLAAYDVDDRVIYVNDRACELLGYAREEILGTRPYDHVDAAAAAAIKGQLQQRRRVQDDPYELTISRKDGTPVHLLISGSPLFDKHGVYTGSMVITTDITVQKQAAEALRLALAKEKELGELKSRFVSMASHEFRTPLATVLAVTETLRIYRHKLSDVQIEQRFAKIEDQVHHLKEIMDDVLLLAQMQARRLECKRSEVDLDALYHSVLDEFISGRDGSERLAYQSNVAGRLVWVDPKLMRQILSNLVANAIKYSPADKPIVVALELSSDMLTLVVRDEGIGIPPADLPHLFEPFHRATNVGNIAGTGLGLIIIKEAVDLHGGTIKVESQVNRGATFIVQLPIMNSPKDPHELLANATHPSAAG